MIQLKRLHEDAVLPSRGSLLATGYDLHSVEEVVIPVGDTVLVPTGLALMHPPGHPGLDIQIRSRSGLAVKHQISVPNAPGTIDLDYQGEIKVALINLGVTDYVVRKGDRVAQMVFGLVTYLPMTLSDLPFPDIYTERGDGGFGS